jgi:hypothetical protein
MKQTTSADLVGKFLLRVIVLCAFVGGFLLWASGAFAVHNGPAEWSLRGVASWAQPLTASGSALPAAASYTAGDLFFVQATGMASPSLYRLTSAGAWATVSADLSGYYTKTQVDATITAAIAADPGVATHSDLANLAYADSGHTGFASSGALLPYARTTEVNATLSAAVATLSAEIAAVEGGVATHSELSNLAYADSGHTGFEKLVASGTELPATATYNIGDLFLVVDPATTTVLLYCLNQGPAIIDWNPISGVGFVGVATLTHNELANLAFADSGHTGFASEAALADYYTKTLADATISAAITEAGLGSGGTGDPTLLAVPSGVEEGVGQTWITATDSPGVYWYSLESLGTGIVLGGDQSSGNAARVYRSLDYGLTWAVATTTPYAYITDITHCGSGTAVAGAGATGCILKSVDHGGSWSLASDTTSTAIYTVLSCGNGIVLAFGGATGIIYRSTSWGNSWAIATDTTETNFRSSAYCGGGKVCAGGTASGAIWISSDYGVTWSTATETGSSIISSMMSMGGGVVLAGGEDTKYVYRSTDYGATWAAVYTASGAVSAMANIGGGYGVIGEGSTAIIYLTTDYGLTWTTVENVAQTRIDSLCHAGYGVLLAGTSGLAVLYRSADAYSPSYIGPSASFPSTATPTGPLLWQGYHWYDANDNKVKVWDGAAWNALW